MKIIRKISFFLFFWTIMAWNIVIVMIIHLSILLEYQKKCHSQKIITWKFKPIVPNNMKKKAETTYFTLIKPPLIALWLQYFDLNVDIYEMRCQIFHMIFSNCGTRRLSTWQVTKDHSEKTPFLWLDIKNQITLKS